jgi:hypothetical protein
VLSRRQRPAERADHARRDRPRQPERVADGDDQLPDDKVVGLAELGRRRRVPARAQHREVGQRVRADHTERHRRAVPERRGAVVRLPDDVRVREQEAVSSEDDRRAEAVGGPAAGPGMRHAEARDLRRQPFSHPSDDLGVCIEWLHILITALHVK